MPLKPEAQLIRACSTGRVAVVQDLLGQGLSPETRDQYGLTGLIWAGRKGHIDVAKLLITSGADLEAMDRRGRTVLFHAIACRRHAFVKFLVGEGALLTHVDAHGWTALDLASVPADMETMELLSKLGAPRRSTKEPVEDRIQ